MNNNKKNTFVAEIILGAVTATLFTPAMIFGLLYGILILFDGAYRTSFIYVSGSIFGILGTLALWKGAFFFQKPAIEQNRKTAKKIAVFLIIGMIPAILFAFSSISSEFKTLPIFLILLGPIAVASRYLVLIAKLN